VLIQMCGGDAPANLTPVLSDILTAGTRMSGRSLPRPRQQRLAQNSVLSWNPLDVVDHHELDLHIATLQFQPERLPKRGKEVGFRRGNVGTWGRGR
jgi:hypothetical protein